jgi:hypothetical protein
MSKIKPAESGKEIEFTSYLNCRHNFSVDFKIEEEKSSVQKNKTTRIEETLESEEDPNLTVENTVLNTENELLSPSKEVKLNALSKLKVTMLGSMTYKFKQDDRLRNIAKLKRKELDRRSELIYGTTHFK